MADNPFGYANPVEQHEADSGIVNPYTPGTPEYDLYQENTGTQNVPPPSDIQPVTQEQQAAAAQAKWNEAVQSQGPVVNYSGQIVQPAYATPKNPWDVLEPKNVTPEQAANNAAVDIAMTEKTAQITSAPAVANIVNNVWQAITPWADEKGETFLDAVKGYPEYWLKSQQVPDQSELAKVYEAEQQSPAWYKLIFGQTVIRDGDKYFQLVQGESPMISPAMEGLTATKAAFKSIKPLLTVAPADVGLSDAAYIRFLNARIANPELSVESFKAVGETSMAKTFRILEEGRQNSIMIGNQAGKVTARNFAARSSEVYRPDLTGEFTPEALKGSWYKATAIAEKPAAASEEIANSLSKVSQIVDNSVLTASETVKVLVDQGAISAALSTRTLATLQLLDAVAPSIKNAALAIVSSKLSNAITSGKSQVAVQELARAEVVEVTSAANKAASDSKTSAKLQSVTKAAIKSVSESQPSTKAQAGTNSQLKAQTSTSTQTKPATKTQTETQTVTKTQAKTQAKTATAQVAPSNVIKDTGRVTRPPDKPSAPKIPPIIFTDDDGKKVRLTAEDGAVAWKQGFVLHYQVEAV